MNELVIDVSIDGRVQALHMDEFPLSFLGKMHVTRASEIKYNSNTQRWDIGIPHGSVFVKTVGGFCGYDLARKFEVAWLQECRKQGCSPLSEEGYTAARGVAEKYAVKVK